MPVPMPPETLAALGIRPEWIGAQAALDQQGAPPPIPTTTGVLPIDRPVDPAALALQQNAPPQPAPPETPTALPSSPDLERERQRAREPEQAPDYQIPVQAFGKPAGQVAAPAAPASQRSAAQQRPMSPDEKLARAELKQSEADRVGMEAIADETAVQRQQARAEVDAYAAYDKQAQAAREQQKAFAAESAKVHAEKTAQVGALTKQADDYKVDRNKFINQLGIGGKVQWGIAMVLSSIGQAMMRQGGPNPVLQMLQDKISESVNAQLDERDQLRRRAVGAQHELDKYDAYSKDRQAQALALEARAEHDLGMMLKESAAKSKDAQAIANGEKAAADILKSSAEKAQKSAEFASTNDIARKQLAVSQANLGVSQFSARETQRHNLATEQLTGQQRDLEALKLERQGKDNEAKLVRERSIGGAASLTPVDKAEAKPGEKYVTKDGQKYRMDLGIERQKDGSVWIPTGTEASVTDLQKQHPVATSLVGTIDKILALGPEWLSDTGNSDKKQKLDELFGAAKTQATAALGLGVPTGKDIELATGALGTEDPTTFRPQRTGLRQARRTAVRRQSDLMKTHGYDHDWAPASPEQETSKPTRVQDLQTEALRQPQGNPETARQEAFTSAYKANGGDTPAARIAAEQAADAARSGKPGPRQLAAIEELKKAAISGDADAAAALGDIIKSREATVRSGPGRIFGTFDPRNSPDFDPIRRLAAEALAEVQAGKQAPASTTSTGPTYDPLGYNPEALVRRFHQPPPGPTIQP